MRLRKRKLGWVNLSLEGTVVTAPNNQGFGVAISKAGLEIKGMFVALPERRSVDIREGKIREFLGADPDKVYELHLDHERTKRWIEGSWNQAAEEIDEGFEQIPQDYDPLESVCSQEDDEMALTAATEQYSKTRPDSAQQPEEDPEQSSESGTSSTENDQPALEEACEASQVQTCEEDAVLTLEPLRTMPEDTDSLHVVSEEVEAEEEKAPIPEKESDQAIHEPVLAAMQGIPSETSETAESTSDFIDCQEPTQNEILESEAPPDKPQLLTGDSVEGREVILSLAEEEEAPGIAGSTFESSEPIQDQTLESETPLVQIKPTGDATEGREQRSSLLEDEETAEADLVRLEKELKSALSQFEERVEEDLIQLDGTQEKLITLQDLQEPPLGVSPSQAKRAESEDQLPDLETVTQEIHSDGDWMTEMRQSEMIQEPVPENPVG
jgi:hypothetical protein